MAGTVTVPTPSAGILHTYYCVLTYTTTSDTAEVPLPLEWGQPDILIAEPVQNGTPIESAAMASYDAATGIATVDRKKVAAGSFISAAAFRLMFLWTQRLPGGAQV